MTRRERLEAKVERRHVWATKASERAANDFARADAIASNIPLGQPILVGHHSEKHARADQRRIHSAMDKGCEEYAKAQYHERKADGLAHQLDRTIYADDDNAIEALEKRAAWLEAHADEIEDKDAEWDEPSGFGRDTTEDRYQFGR